MAYIDTNFIHLKENQISDKECELLEELKSMEEELEDKEFCIEFHKDYKERIEEIKFELLSIELARG